MDKILNLQRLTKYAIVVELILTGVQSLIAVIGIPLLISSGAWRFVVVTSLAVAYLFLEACGLGLIFYTVQIKKIQKDPHEALRKCLLGCAAVGVLTIFEFITLLALGICFNSEIFKRYLIGMIFTVARRLVLFVVLGNLLLILKEIPVQISRSDNRLETDV